MKLRELFDIQPALVALTGPDIGIPSFVGWKINRFIKKISDVYKEYLEYRNDLIVKLGEEIPDPNDPDKTMYRVKDENIESFNKQNEDLLDVEENIDVPKLTIYDLGNVRISISVLAKLDGVVLFETL